MQENNNKYELTILFIDINPFPNVEFKVLMVNSDVSFFLIRQKFKVQINLMLCNTKQKFYKAIEYFYRGNLVEFVRITLPVTVVSFVLVVT